MSCRGPNEGSICQRQDGRWAGSAHLGYEGGRRVRKHVLAHSRKEVAERLDELLRAKRERRPIPDQREKLGPYLRRWLDGTARPTYGHVLEQRQLQVAQGMDAVLGGWGDRDYKSAPLAWAGHALEVCRLIPPAQPCRATS